MLSSCDGHEPGPQHANTCGFRCEQVGLFMKAQEQGRAWGCSTEIARAERRVDCSCLGLQMRHACRARSWGYLCPGWLDHSCTITGSPSDPLQIPACMPSEMPMPEQAEQGGHVAFKQRYEACFGSLGAEEGW